MGVWQDDTSYRQGERGTVELRSWVCAHGSLRVHVFRKRHDEGRWFTLVIFRGCTIEGTRLTSIDLGTAKIEALRLAAAAANDIIGSVIELAGSTP